MKSGSLVVVGAGLRPADHLTAEAAAAVRQADRVLYLVCDPAGEQALRQLNPRRSEFLAPLYAAGRPLPAVYDEMVDRVAACVRGGMRTCLAMYGHPGLLVVPSHRAIRRVRGEGYAARMLPGVSAEDCLFADLEIDPAMTGWQSYWAADFLICGRRVDPTSAVVLWGVGGMTTWTAAPARSQAGAWERDSLDLLRDRLIRDYPPDHEVVLYEAAVHPVSPPRISRVPLAELPQSDVTLATTLYIPPSRPAPIDETLCARLHVTRAAFEALREEG